MRQFWSWLAVWCGKHAGLVGVIGLLLTLTLAAGTTQLKFQTSQASYLNRSDQIYKDDVRYEQLFGGQAMVVMFTMNDGATIDQFFTPQNVTKLDAMVAQLHAGAAQHEIVGVLAPTTVLTFSSNLVTEQVVDGQGVPAADITKSIAGASLLRATAVDPTAAGKAARRQGRHHHPQPRGGGDRGQDPDQPGLGQVPALQQHPDAHHPPAAAHVLPRHRITPRSSCGSRATSPSTPSPPRPTTCTQTAAKYHFSNATTLTTGAPALLENINNYLKGGMFLLGGIAALVMIVILLVLFDVRWRLLPLGVIVIGLIWAFGMAGYLHIPLTLATIAGLPVMLGVGIDYAIQMQARVEEEVVLNKSEHPIQETARNLCPALLVVTFDAVFAFSALYFAKVPMIRQFGALLAVGIVMICLCSILAPLAALGIREYKSPTVRQPSKRSEALGRLVEKMGGLPTRSAVPLIILSLLVFFGGILVEGKLTLQTDPVQWVNPHSQVIHDINALEHGTGSANELGVFVQAPDVFTNDVVRSVDLFTTAQLKINADKLVSATSIVASVSDLINDVPGANHVVPTGTEVHDAYLVAPGDLQRASATDNARAMNIVFRTGTPLRSSLALDKQAALVDHHARPAHAQRHHHGGQGRDLPRRPAGGGHRHPVGAGRGGRGPARQPRVEPGAAHVPGHPVRRAVPGRAAAQPGAVVAVAGARADRGGGRLAGGLRAAPQAEPAHRRGWTAGGGRVHRVHVADPVALRGGAGQGLRPRGGGRPHRLAHRSGLHRVGPDRHLRRGRHRHVVDAPAA